MNNNHVTNTQDFAKRVLHSPRYPELVRNLAENPLLAKATLEALFGLVAILTLVNTSPYPLSEETHEKVEKEIKDFLRD